MQSVFTYYVHKMDITHYYGLLLAVTMDLREVRRTSTEYRGVTFYSCLNLLCTYLEHVQYYHLLHGTDITCYYGLLLAVTMDLPGACKVSTGYIDITCYHLLSCLYYALTWSMCSIATYYIEWTSLSLLCTYLAYAKCFHLLHRMDITHYYGLLLAVTMDLREVR